MRYLAVTRRGTRCGWEPSRRYVRTVRPVASLTAVFLFQHLKDVRHVYTVTAVGGVVAFVCETVLRSRDVIFHGGAGRLG